MLLAVEEGAIALADPLGPPGATVAHLLCHAGGWDFDTDRILAPPGTRRIYSNTGYDALAAHVSRMTGMPFADYLSEGILEPLGMIHSELRGSAAKDLFSNVQDQLLLIDELALARSARPLHRRGRSQRPDAGPGRCAAGLGGAATL